MELKLKEEQKSERHKLAWEVTEKLFSFSESVDQLKTNAALTEQAYIRMGNDIKDLKDMIKELSCDIKDMREEIRKIERVVDTKFAAYGAWITLLSFIIPFAIQFFQK